MKDEQKNNIIEERNNSEPNSSSVWRRATPYERLKFVMVALIIIASGMIAVNQFVGYRDKMLLTQVPCTACAQQMPAKEMCISNCITGQPIGSAYGNNIQGLNLTIFGSGEIIK